MREILHGGIADQLVGVHALPEALQVIITRNDLDAVQGYRLREHPRLDEVTLLDQVAKENAEIDRKRAEAQGNGQLTTDNEQHP